MIHFDTNALIALPEWVQQKMPTVMRAANGEATAVRGARLATCPHNKLRRRFGLSHS